MKQLIINCFLLLCTLVTYSQPGSIDQSFGDKGFVRTATNKTNFYSDGRASALQADGRILAGGKSLITGILEIICYLPDGTIDSSFGNNGIAEVKANPVFSGNISAITIQADKKIIVAGDKWGLPHTESVFAARFMPDGTLDNTFGNQGITKLDFGDYASVSSIALQHDGRILLAGGAGTDPEAVLYEYSTVICLNADGTINKSFSGDGRLENGAANYDNAIVIQEDGKITTAGYQYLGINDNPDYVVSRYNIDGTLDENFGSKGNAINDGFDLDFDAESVALQPDGKIVVGSYSIASTGYAMTALRYNENGSLDNSFGMEGKAVVLFEGKSSKAYQVLLQPDGKIILAGSINTHDPGNYADFALCRLNKDGSVDSSFGIDGRQVTTLEPTGEIAHSALLNSDGKIVLIGNSGDSRGVDYSDLLLVRYNGDKEQKSLIARIKQFLHNHGISWQGLDSKSISYYSIQYSKEGRSFAEKGKLSGAGSSRLQDYNFSVADAGFYRVMAVDKQGYKTFSNKVMVSAGDLSSNASVYPNPVRDYVTVQGLKNNEQTNISIANGSGTVLAKGTSSGSTQYRAPAANLQPGTYYLHITSGSKRETIKFVKE